MRGLRDQCDADGTSAARTSRILALAVCRSYYAHFEADCALVSGRSMVGPIDKSRKAIKKEQHEPSPAVAEFEGPHSHLVREAPLPVFGIAHLSDHCLLWIEQSCRATADRTAHLHARDCDFVMADYRELVPVRVCWARMCLYSRSSRRLRLREVTLLRLKRLLLKLPTSAPKLDSQGRLSHPKMSTQSRKEAERYHCCCLPQQLVYP